MKKLWSGNGKFLFSFSILLQIVYTVGTVGVAVLLNYLIDTVYQVIKSGEQKQLLQCGVVCLVYALILGSITFLNERIKALCMKNQMVHIRSQVGKGILSNGKTIQEKDNANKMTLLNQNMSSFEENYVKNTYQIISSMTSILVGIVLLININPIIAVISIVAMAIPSFLPSIFSKKLGNNQREIMAKTTLYNANISDLLNGNEVIQTYQISNLFAKKHSDFAKEMEESKNKMSKTMATLLSLSGFLSVVVQFSIMTLSGVFAMKGLITIGSIVAVTQLSGQVISPAFGLSTKLAQFKSAKPIKKEIVEMMQKAENMDYVEKKTVSSKIELKNLSFSYENNTLLNKVNASFEAGKKYLLTGKSGSGKSTLLRIINGQINQEEGSLLVDGVSGICDASVVSQNVFLFNDTIKNNITLYQEYSKEALQSVIEKAGLADVLGELEEGIDTKVQENGARFSGGERQRIAIARALLHGKNVLLLDEATSALDEETAKKIENELLALEGVTCIAISHTLYPEIVAKYDGVYHLEESKLSRKAQSNIA